MRPPRSAPACPPRARGHHRNPMDETDAQRCGGCRHRLVDAAQPLAVYGFHRCRYLPAWRTLSEGARCRLRYNAEHHKRNAQATRRKALRKADMFDAVQHRRPAAVGPPGRPKDSAFRGACPLFRHRTSRSKVQILRLEVRVPLEAVPILMPADQRHLGNAVARLEQAAHTIVPHVV